MKKFIYLIAMVCTLGFFTACSSDDDDPNVWETFKAGTYNVWGEELDTEDGDVDYNYWDFDMKIEKAGNQTAKVTLTDKKGEVTINVPEATVIALDGYTLRGQGKATFKEDITRSQLDPSSMYVDFTAKISADYKNISVELKTADGTFKGSNSEKPAVSKLLATWNLEPVTMYNKYGHQTDDPYAAYSWKGSFKMNWNISSDSPIMITPELSAQDVESILNQSLPMVLKTVAFTADGKIIAQYSEANYTPKWQIAEDYATYKVVDESKILVFLNNEKIVSTITDPAKKAAINALLAVFKDGIPVNVRFNDIFNTAFFYLDQAYVTELLSNPVIVKMLEINEQDGYNVLILKTLVQQLPELMEKTTKFEVGLELMK